MTRAALGVGLVCLLVPELAHAAFERAPVGPEAAALGGTVATSDDAVFGNPAAWLTGADQRLSCWFAHPFGLAELRESQVGVAIRTGRTGLGFGARSFGSGAYGEREARVGGAWLVVPDVVVGLSVRGMVVRGDGFPPVRSAAADLGLRLRAERNTELGVVVEALVGEVPGDSSGRRRRTSIGLAHDEERWSVCLEVGRREGQRLTGNVGFSGRPWSGLALHCGIREDPRTVSWGLTTGLPVLRVAVGVENVNPLGTTIRVGLVAVRSPDRESSRARIRSSKPLTGRF
jgi:hypothetical protein